MRSLLAIIILLLSTFASATSLGISSRNSRIALASHSRQFRKMSIFSSQTIFCFNPDQSDDQSAEIREIGDVSKENNDCLDKLVQMGIEHRAFSHKQLFTVSEAEDEVDKEIPGVSCKNLFLRDKRHGLYLLTTLGDRKINFKAFSNLLKLTPKPSFSFAKEELLSEKLGVKKGSVTPFAIMNDKDKAVTICLDSQLLEQELINCHPLRNDMTVVVTPMDLVKFIDSTGHDIKIIDFGAINDGQEGAVKAVSFYRPMLFRREPDSLLFMTDPNDNGEIDQKRFSYRNAKADDIPAISELCADSFEGPFNIFQFWQRNSAVNNFNEQLSQRYADLVLKGFKHSMIVCVDSCAEGKIVGFQEIGMLPAPPDVSKKPASTDPNDEDETSIAAIIESAAKDIDDTDEDPSSSSKESKGSDNYNDNDSDSDVPYLGNVVVSDDVRRMGVGSRLLRVGAKVAQKWGQERLYVAVDCGNSPAVQMYLKAKFIPVLDERQLIMNKGKPRIFLAVETK